MAERRDATIDRLIARYGKPSRWVKFPVVIEPFSGRFAGYAQRSGDRVVKVAVCAGYVEREGGTLDREPTRAYLVYLIGGNIDLFLNEGTAQISEWANRAKIRETVWRRYSNGEFIPFDRLYGRNSYDGALLVYREGFNAVDYLIGLGGSARFAQFVYALENGDEPIQTRLKEFYGFEDLRAFERAAFEFIANGRDRSTMKGLLNNEDEED